jgi:hypothetical protein
VTIAASSGSAPSNACEAGKGGVSKACLRNNIQSSDTKANFAEQNYKNNATNHMGVCNGRYILLGPSNKGCLRLV